MTEKILSVGTNMHKARVFLKSKGYEPSKRQEILNSIRTDIPNVRNCNCKFLLGVTRMFIDNEISSGETISGINNALRYITNETHFSEYDYNLNGLSANTIIDRFKTISIEEFDKDKVDSKKRTKGMKNNDEYTIIPVDNYDVASKYSKYTSWCVTHSDSAFKSYTCEGRGRFYFCLKKGFENAKAIVGKNTPLDEYGLSMIAVSVTMEGECNTITCRWNHDNGGNDSVMTVQDIEKLLGGSFYEMFPPFTKEYLKEHNLYVSENIGKYYLDMNRGIEGIVVAVDKDEKPTSIINISEQYVMNWNEAMEYNSKLTNGWHVPSKEELEDIWFIKSYDNVITKKINNGLKRYDSIIYQKVSVDSYGNVIWINPEGETKKFVGSEPILI